MSFCPGKKWALVKFSNAEGGSGSYISYKPPIDVATERTDLNQFKGGQCPCIHYQFDYEIRWRTYGYNIDYSTYKPYEVTTEYTGKGTSNIWGGMSQAIVEISQGRLDWRVNGTDRNCQSFYRSFVVAGDADVQVLGKTMSQRAENISFILSNIIRLDGKADNCGDPPSGCFLVVRQGGTEVFRKKGIGSSCPKFQVGCDDSCAEGMHKEPDGKCCCDNSQDLKRLAGDIRNQLKGLK